MSELPLTVIERRIAKRLEVRRKLLGISVERMAFVISHTDEEYLKYETANKRINPALLSELSYLLNIRLGGSAIFCVWLYSL